VQPWMYWNVMISTMKPNDPTKGGQECSGVQEYLSLRGPQPESSSFY
jgi:hypothetical protein